MTCSDTTGVAGTKSPSVRTGADHLLESARCFLEGKRIGILTNHTGVLSDGRHTIDAVASSGLGRLAALFGPEHGITGETADGEAVGHATHPRYGVPVYSLYGNTHKPTPDMLRDVDVILCDIQDVGVRFYTFISTVALALEAAAEQGIFFVLLDRPNPIRGLDFDGPVRVPSLKCFVAWMPLPVTHGLTLGELASMWNGESQLAGGVRADLHVVRMDGWRRAMWFDETGLDWVAPSPNMRTLSTAIVYPGMCFFEGTSVSEGRGTDSPFELVGAPWVDPERILRELGEFGTSGVAFSAEEFTPRQIAGAASKPKYEGELCRGIRVKVRDRSLVRPVRLGVALLSAFKRAHPREMEIRNRRFDILTGSQSVRRDLERGAGPEEIAASWQEGLDAYGGIRTKYLLYS